MPQQDAQSKDAARQTERSFCASGLTALLLACFIWFGAALAASADAHGPADAPELVIDLRPRAALEMVPDAGIADDGPRLPTPSYRRAGDRALSQVRVAPWPPKQGQTLAVILSGAQPISYTLTFGGRPYHANASASGRSAWSLVPVPPLTPPGYIPLVAKAGGETFTLNVPIRAGQFETINIPAATAGPILSETNKVAAETKRMTALFAGFTPGGWTPQSRFTPPLVGEFRHTSAFGSRRTYGNDPALSAHAGEDYSAAAGTPVYAPAAGKVVLAETMFVRGNAVVLDHGHGVFTGYWHLSELAVKEGETVETGQLLGKVGSTGLSTGAHLHWELRVEGMAVDPLQWVK